MAMPLIPMMLLSLTACGDQTEAASGTEPEQVSGRVFVGDDVTGHQLVDGSTLRLDFTDGLGVTAGCNHLGGTGRVQEGILVATVDSMTEMGCDQRLMEQDTWLADFLQSRPTASVDARELVLSSAGTTIRLTDEASIRADHPIDLQGTTWSLDSLIDGSGADGAVSSMPGDATASVRFEGGRMTVDTDCNQGSAQVDITDDTIRIGPLGLTKRACGPEAAAVEKVLVDVLAGQVAYTQDYDVLTVTSSDGTAGLQFRAP